MRLRKVNPDFLFLLLLVGCTIYSMWGVKRIPFHPDEATQLFMSRDFDLAIRNPTSIAWKPETEVDLRQQYRLLDAPLTRYYLGLARSIGGFIPLPADWDWSKTWEENEAAGALPSGPLLLVSRLSITLLLPVSLLLIYWIGKKIQSGWSGIAAAALYGTNALVLLHQRRAMAEGLLILGVLFVLWAMLAARDRPIWIALATALAFNAKQSAAALIPVALLALVIASRGRSRIEAPTGIKWAGFLVVFAAITCILNPVLWTNPVHVAVQSWQARQGLVQRQVAAIGSLDPRQILESPGERVAVLLAQVYLVPPSPADVGNYTAQTGASEAEYLSIPGHNLFRTPLWAGVSLCLTLFAWTWVVLNRRRMEGTRRVDYFLLFAATLALAGGLVITVPLPFQRYFLPVVPIATLWTAVGLEAIIRMALRWILVQRAPQTAVKPTVQNETSPASEVAEEADYER